MNQTLEHTANLKQTANYVKDPFDNIFFANVYLNQVIQQFNIRFLGSHINKGKINEKLLEIKDLIKEV